MARALRLWGPPVAFMALVYVGSTMPSPPVPPTLSDKVLHLMTYAVLAALFARALVGGLPARLPVRTVLLAVGLAVAYGAALEVRQSFIEARSADLADAYANAAGACGGAAACWLWGTIASRPAPGDRPK